MEEAWLDGLGARCSCSGPSLSTMQETAFCGRQYRSRSLWLQSLRLPILPLMWYRTTSSPACQGPVLQHLADVQGIPYVISYVNFTTSKLAYTLHRQANSQTLCPGTLMMYIDIPICLSSISVCILAKIGNHLQINGNTLKDSGLHFHCIKQIPNTAHRLKKNIILPSRFLLSSLNLSKCKFPFPRSGFAIQQHLFSSCYKPGQDTVSWDWVVIVQSWPQFKLSRKRTGMCTMQCLYHIYEGESECVLTPTIL